MICLELPFLRPLVARHYKMENGHLQTLLSYSASTRALIPYVSWYHSFLVFFLLLLLLLCCLGSLFMKVPPYFHLILQFSPFRDQIFPR